MTDDLGHDEGLTEEDEQPLANLPEELVARIDAALLAETKNRFLKVVRIVDAVMGSIPNVPKDVPVVFYAQRIAHLVRTGQMESQGDLRRMGLSEVRLPASSKS
jgi:hypothetical protein